MNAEDISEINLISILNDPIRRHLLMQAIAKEQDSYLPLSNRYAQIAPFCHANSEQLSQTVDALLHDEEAKDCLLCDLVFHPAMPDDVLMRLCEQDICISDLGHRRGPQQLLEKIAETYAYPEAITTLALSYYSADSYDVTQFAAFVKRHANDGMLKYNLVRDKKLSAEKQQVVRQIFSVAKTLS